MRLRVRKTELKWGPGEVIVHVSTVSGEEELIVAEKALDESTIEIGYPVAQDRDSNYLVELPRETSRGQWRVWVPRSDVINDRGRREVA